MQSHGRITKVKETRYKRTTYCMIPIYEILERVKPQGETKADQWLPGQVGGKQGLKAREISKSLEGWEYSISWLQWWLHKHIYLWKLIKFDTQNGHIWIYANDASIMLTKKKNPIFSLCNTAISFSLHNNLNKAAMGNRYFLTYKLNSKWSSLIHSFYRILHQFFWRRQWYLERFNDSRVTQILTLRALSSLVNLAFVDNMPLDSPSNLWRC